MTNLEKRTLVAEAMGFEVLLIDSPDDGLKVYRKLKTESGPPCEEIPNYPESLDACAEFERWLKLKEDYDIPGSLYGEYLLEISNFVWRESYFGLLFIDNAISATPEQRVDAFLKVMGIETNAKAESHNM